MWNVVLSFLPISKVLPEHSKSKLIGLWLNCYASRFQYLYKAWVQAKQAHLLKNAFVEFWLTQLKYAALTPTTNPLYRCSRRVHPAFGPSLMSHPYGNSCKAAASCGANEPSFNAGVFW